VSATTLGRELFSDPLHGTYTVSDIRQKLEIKLAACLATGGCNGFPPHINRVRDPRIRSLVAAGLIFEDWSTGDLARCHGNLTPAATLALIATLDNPRWGAADLLLLGLIEQMETFAASAQKGGITL
jgi:hypothetical protein